MKKVYLLPLLLLSLCGVSDAFSQPKLAVIGSSTSACFGIEGQSYCYINQVTSFYGLDASHYFNIAVPGMGVNSAMPDEFLNQYYDGYDIDVWSSSNITAAMGVNGNCPPGWHPDVVLVNFPTNHFDVLNVADIMYYFRTITNYAIAHGAQVYVTTTQPRTAFGPEARDTLMVVRDSILAEYGSHAIDFWTGLAAPDGTILPQYDRGDGIHLTVDGQNILFDRVKASGMLSVSTPLPVKLTSFNATLKNGQPFLQWTADTETPGTQYLVQRSGTGADFETIATISGQELASGNRYSYTDADATGTVYYRLQVVEYDNKFYSDIRLLKLGEMTGSFAIKSLYPVPATGSQMTLQVQSGQKQTIRIEISSTLGVTLRTFSRSLENGTVNIPVPVSALGSGTYFLKITTNDAGTYIKKFTRN